MNVKLIIFVIGRALAAVAFFCVCATPFSVYGQRISQSQRLDKEKEKPVTEQEAWRMLEGRWKATSAVLGGRDFPDSVVQSLTLEIKTRRYRVVAQDVEDLGKLAIHTEETPWQIDIVGEEGPNRGRTIPCIFKFEDEKLLVCYQNDGDQRPAEFESPSNSTFLLITYERVKGEKPKPDR